MLKRKLLAIVPLVLIIYVLGQRGCNETKGPDVLSIPIRNVYKAATVSGLVRHGVNKATSPSVQPSYVPPEAVVTITPKDKTKHLADLIDVKVKGYGLTFKPGIQATFPLGIGLDVKLAFYRRYGGGIGLLYLKEDRAFAGSVFASRHFEYLDNLEAVVGAKVAISGITTPYAGLRLSF